MNARLVTSIAILCFLGLLAPAEAMQSATTPQGLRYQSGGIGHAERQTLHAQRQDFSLWLTTAVRRSGAYMANVEVQISDAASGSMVLQHVMDGPWLFVALPPGRYKVEAVFRHEGQAQVQTGTTTIHVGDHHQMMFYFTADAEVGDVAAVAQPPKPYASAARQ